MTKLRAPLTPHRAICRIADAIGFDGCAEVLGKSESFVRKLSDPDAGREVSFNDAVRLDAAYRRAGGQGAPMLECFAGRLDLMVPEGEEPAGALLESSGNAAIETAEAVAAAIAAAANPLARFRAMAETEVDEGIQSLQTLRTILRRIGGGS